MGTPEDHRWESCEKAATLDQAGIAKIIIKNKENKETKYPKISKLPTSVFKAVRINTKGMISQVKVEFNLP